MLTIVVKSNTFLFLLPFLFQLIAKFIAQHFASTYGTSFRDGHPGDDRENSTRETWIDAAIKCQKVIDFEKSKCHQMLTCKKRNYEHTCSTALIFRYRNDNGVVNQSNCTLSITKVWVYFMPMLLITRTLRPNCQWKHLLKCCMSYLWSSIKHQRWANRENNSG